MKLGKLDIPIPVFLAPMAGITDPPFRTICREYGCPVAYSEMISAAGICQGGKRTLAYLKMATDRGPTIIQIFGSDPVLMGKAANFSSRIAGAAAIDINMGCPVKKVTKIGAGSALMADPELAMKITSSVKASTNLPVTVKFRSGLSHEEITAVEFAIAMEKAGADVIAIHARTASQGYSGKADLSVIAEVKKAVKIPVIGNGDIFNADDMKRMISVTNCDGVMVGRGALGNPWIFRDILNYFNTGLVTNCRPSKSELFETVMKHLDYMIGHRHDEEAAVKAMRKHFVYYTRGLRNSAAMRPLMMKAVSKEGITILLKELFDASMPD